MTDEQDRLNQLSLKQETLARQQKFLSDEIDALSREIQSLKVIEKDRTKETLIPPVATNLSKEISAAQTKNDLAKDVLADMQKMPAVEPSKVFPKVPAFQMRSDFEKFIGENLISKIGIAITVIGVAIGAKYSIEHDLISPLTRIILGYLAGLALLVVGIKLKAKFEDYSAVLVSGAMAIFYFITYAAYDFYQLFPQALAFVLMVVFTAFTVLAALQYNRQVIAIIGLAGSYAVPFLLSDNSGRVWVLFSYMALINMGILFIAIKKYWKLLNIIAFGLTWLIFLGWYIAGYSSSSHFSLAFTFAGIFFLIFYTSFLSYKLIYKEKFLKGDVVLILLNAFLFFGIGYALLDDTTSGEEFLGLFTLANAVIHFMIAAIIYRLKLADKNLFYLVAGLVLVFITMAIPVQLEGNWITLLWTGEAALLFWIGRTKQISFYEKLSYALMLLATLSIFQDWSNVYNRYYFDKSQSFTPILNIHFLTSVLFIAGFGLINFIHQNKKYPAAVKEKNTFYPLLNIIIPLVFLLGIYLSLRFEIAHYWDQLFAGSQLPEKDPEDSIYLNNSSNDFYSFKQIWLVNYTMAFLVLLAFVNLWKLNYKRLGEVVLALQVMTVLIFLILGLYSFSELRHTYLHPVAGGRGATFFNIAIRYVSYVFLMVLLYSSYRYMRIRDKVKWFNNAFDIGVHLVVVWVLSSELINLLVLADFKQSDKLGLSILWGIYALFLIVVGIWKGKKPLRLMAIALFGITLIKLFFYDIAHLDTMDKTVVFISLGILLLIISFLYNKYKHIISNEVSS